MANASATDPNNPVGSGRLLNPTGTGDPRFITTKNGVGNGMPYYNTDNYSKPNYQSGGNNPNTPDDYGKARVADLTNTASQAYQQFGVANADARNAQYAAAMDAANARTAPVTDYTAANADAAQAGQSRALQGQVANSYLGTINGTTPSVAQAQFAQAQDAVRQQNASMAASARGGGLARASAQDQAIQQNSQMGQANAAQSAALRAQEIATAQQGLAGVSTTMRSGDQGQQNSDAQQAQYDSGMAMTNRSQNDALANQYLNQQTALDTQQYQGQLARQQAIDSATAEDQNQQAINNGAAQAATTRDDSYLAAGATAAGAVLGTLAAPGAGTAAGAAGGAAAGKALTSDKREKVDIRSADDKIKAFLDAMSAHDYSYKNPGTPGEAPGRHVSPMAQELTKSEVGARLVKETPNGIKMIEYGPEAMASAFAAMAHLNKRMNDMEARKGKSNSKSAR